MPRTGRPVTTPAADNPVSNFRRARGWSQAAAAEALGVSHQAISAYESGARPIPQTVLLLIACIEKAP